MRDSGIPDRGHPGEGVGGRLNNPGVNACGEHARLRCRRVREAHLHPAEEYDLEIGTGPQVLPCNLCLGATCHTDGRGGCWVLDNSSRGPFDIGPPSY